MDSLKEIYQSAGIEEDVYDFCDSIQKGLKERFEQIDGIAEYNQMKVIRAMERNKVSTACFESTTGYGYDDLGRDTLEAVYAEVFGAESALVRPQITCGTHALTIALSAILRPGDELLSPVGKPYDTLEGVIGIKEDNPPGSLKEFGIFYRQVDLLADGSFDLEGIKNALNEKTKLVTIQRSKGYATRKTLSVKRIGELIAYIKSIRPDVICMVDNCYGEFVETIEPTQAGADLCVGSLIKNAGGGLAPIGGYIVGKEEYIDLCAYRLTAPGLGKEVGATLGVNRSFFHGFFLAPTVTAAALKGAIFAANIYEILGFSVVPDKTESRHDIIQAVTLGSPEAVIAFCRGIQAASPVDSHVSPEPYAMPGYHSDVIMAAGAFVQGSSIELSADGPIEPPYAVYFQGGLTWYHARYGITMSLQYMKNAGLVDVTRLVQ
jgi:cystathionine beta-lyase family protein involved in aluminum resistance